MLYERARDALAACERVDEVKKIADQAAALATYARQASDHSLEDTAVRIRARALRLCGEMFARMPPGRKGQKAAETNGAGAGPQSRASVARAAGMSPRQQKAATRIAAIPEAAFEVAIQSAPTITTLAAMGTKSKVVEATATPLDRKALRARYTRLIEELALVVVELDLDPGVVGGVVKDTCERRKAGTAT